eukprot:7672572-Alexandrium_andersonii.AAC.1
MCIRDRGSGLRGLPRHGCRAPPSVHDIAARQVGTRAGSAGSSRHTSGLSTVSRRGSRAPRWSGRGQTVNGRGSARPRRRGRNGAQSLGHRL